MSSKHAVRVPETQKAVLKVLPPTATCPDEGEMLAAIHQRVDKVGRCASVRAFLAFLVCVWGGYGVCE